MCQRLRRSGETTPALSQARPSPRVHPTQGMPRSRLIDIRNSSRHTLGARLVYIHGRRGVLRMWEDERRVRKRRARALTQFSVAVLDS